MQAVTILPIAFLQFSLVLRDSHVASLLGMTNLGAGAVDGNAFKFVTALGAQGAPLQPSRPNIRVCIPGNAGKLSLWEGSQNVQKKLPFGY